MIRSHRTTLAPAAHSSTLPSPTPKPNLSVSVNGSTDGIRSVLILHAGRGDRGLLIGGGGGLTDAVLIGQRGGHVAAVRGRDVRRICGG